MKSEKASAASVPRSEATRFAALRRERRAFKKSRHFNHTSADSCAAFKLFAATVVSSLRVSSCIARQFTAPAPPRDSYRACIPDSIGYNHDRSGLN